MWPSDPLLDQEEEEENKRLAKETAGDYRGLESLETPKNNNINNL